MNMQPETPLVPQKEFKIPPELQTEFDACHEIMQAAGVTLIQRYELMRRKGLAEAQVVKDGTAAEINWTTQSDIELHRMAVEKLMKQFPEAEILAEEKVEEFNPSSLAGFEKGGYFYGKKGSETRWLVDMLDGTSNFAKGDPHFGIQMALERNGEVVMGIIFRPVTNDWFVALKDGGAWYGYGDKFDSKKARQLHVSSRQDWQEVRMEFEANMNRVLPDAKLIGQQGGEKWRVYGAAVWDFPAIAEGANDGLIARGPTPYDIAPGGLLVEEAGGKVTDVDDSQFNPYLTNVVVSNGIIHRQILEVINSSSKPK